MFWLSNSSFRYTKSSLRGALAALAMACGCSALGQSFNFDIDLAIGSEQNGAGVPFNSFGAAANQPGFWNNISVGDTGPTALFDLDAHASAAVFSASGMGSGGGSNLLINTGNYARLLNDYVRIFDEVTLRVAGLQPGAYRVLTYAIRPGEGEVWPVTITIDGAAQAGQVVTGPMPGNSFAQGITHSVHDIPNLNGDLVIHATAPGVGIGMVNGFQIVAVPEPSTSFLLVPLVLLLRRRRTC